MYTGDAAQPAERRRDVEGAFVDASAPISVDPDLERGAVAVEHERVERPEQDRQRVGPVEREHDDAKIDRVRIRARTSGHARAVRRRTSVAPAAAVVAGVAHAPADGQVPAAARADFAVPRARTDENADQKSGDQQRGEKRRAFVQMRPDADLRSHEDTESVVDETPRRRIAPSAAHGRLGTCRGCTII